MKLIKIEGVIGMPDEVDHDELFSQFLALVEKNGCRFGGGIDDVTDAESAREFATDNRKALLKDSVCGCFHCGKIFPPTEIVRYLDEGNGTAVCPYCNTDSVIGESSGYPITDAFLEKMNKLWY